MGAGRRSRPRCAGTEAGAPRGPGPPPRRARAAQRPDRDGPARPRALQPAAPVREDDHTGGRLVPHDPRRPEVLASFDGLLKAKPYLNGWQTWWLQQPTTRHAGFATGPGAKARVEWARAALVAADHTPVLRAHAALVLARHGKVGEAELLGIYDRSSSTVRPVAAAAVALLKPSAAVRDAVTGDSALNRWSYEWAELFA